MKLLFPRLLTLALLSLSSLSIYAQTVFIGGGNSWDVTGNWQSGDIGDVITDNVTLNASTSALINTGFSYTIGDLTFQNNATLSINSPAGALNVGQSGTPKNVTANNNATINVSGTLIIWGDLTVNTNLSWNTTGTVIIKGNVLMNDNATMFSNGNITIEGNFTGGDNTNFTILGGGHAEVYGSLTVGLNSHFTGAAGSLHVHTCAQGAGSDYCTGGLLPINLLFFKAVAAVDKVNLSWATASEQDFDYFIIEKSTDAVTFYEIDKVEGHDNSEVRIDYSAADLNPTFGRSYYRLTEVDMNRSVTHLLVVTVDFDAAKSVIIGPNPATQGNVNVEFNFVPEHGAIVSVLDLRGVTLLELGTNKQNITLPLQVSPGVYLVMVQADNFKSVSRLLVK